MSRMRTRTATRAGGAAHCTRTAGTAWSNRRTSTVSSASFTRGSRGSCRVAGELVNLSRACALSCLMLGSPYPAGALEALAACARYLCGPAFTSDLAARARAAGELGPPCVGTSFRASTASGLWHSPPGPPVPPGRRVSRLWQDDCTYICAFPVWEYVSAYAARGYTRSALHRYTATRLRGYTPPPDERREGRPWAPSGHAPIFERGAVGASQKPSASAGPISKLGFAAGNPRPETRDPICIPADALRNRKKKGTGVRVAETRAAFA